MFVRVVLLIVGWRFDILVKRVIEYFVLDFEFVEKLKMELLRGFGFCLVDFFVVDF